MAGVRKTQNPSIYKFGLSKFDKYWYNTSLWGGLRDVGRKIKILYFDLVLCS